MIDVDVVIRSEAKLRELGTAVLRATDAYREALNGDGHEGEPHDRVLALGPVNGYEIRDVVSDCSACGGAQYGAEDDLQGAIGDLREALGEQRKPWEYHRESALAEPTEAERMTQHCMRCGHADVDHVSEDGSCVVPDCWCALLAEPTEVERCSDPEPHEPHDDEGTATGAYFVHTCPGVAEPTEAER